MRKRSAIALAILLLLSLMAGLYSRRVGGAREPGVGDGDAGGVPAGGGGKTAAPGEAPGEKPVPPPGNAPKLHGLRLLAAETAAARGWKPPPIAEPDPLHVARKLWSRTKVSLNFADEPFEKMLAWLGDTYGLHARVDTAVSLEGKTVTFKVDDLAGDQALDLLTKMGGLAFTIDVSGTAWVTTVERAKALAAPDGPQTDLWEAGAHRIRREEESRSKRAAKSPERTWKARKVTLSIVRKTIKEAFSELMVAMGPERGLTFGFWTLAATRKAEAALPVSVIAEDITVEKAIEEILRGSGVALMVNDEGTPIFDTEERAEAWRAAAETDRRAEAEDTAEVAAFRKRRVRVRGDLLTAAEVAGQVGEQAGVTLRVSAEVADCQAVWESDGLEQTAGEVLDILARDGELVWRWQGEAEPTSLRYHGPRCLWLVGAKER